MIRVLRSRDGKLEADPRLSRHAPPAAAPSPAAAAAGQRFHAKVAEIADRNRELLKGIEDEALRRSVLKGMR